MKLEQRIELLHRSSRRLMETVELRNDYDVVFFLWREIRLHLRRTLQILWCIMWLTIKNNRKVIKIKMKKTVEKAKGLLRKI